MNNPSIYFQYLASIRKSGLVLLITCLVIVLSSCQSTGLKIGGLDVGKLVNQGIKVWDATTIDQEKEIQFGENIAAVLLGVRPLHSNKAANEYVNKVGGWLAANSSRPDLPWKFGVIDSDAINAFAAPGGYIFVTSAMLVQLNSEAELAAVLAHEISHVTLHHHLTALTSGTLRTAASEVLFVSADAYHVNTNASQKERKNTAWAKTVTSVAQDLYSRGLHRDDEIAADKNGILLLAKSGYDPYAYLSSLQIVQAIAPDDTSLALLYKTHPKPTERIQALTPMLNSMEKVTGLTVTNRFTQTISGR